MTDGIEFEGFEQLERFVKNGNVTPEDESKAIRKALNPIKNQLEKDTPKGLSKKLSHAKITIKKEGFATAGIVKAGSFYGMFQEFGTSKSKKHVGYFERAVECSKNEALEILSEEILNKIK